MSQSSVSGVGDRIEEKEGSPMKKRKEGRRTILTFRLWRRRIVSGLVAIFVLAGAFGTGKTEVAKEKEEDVLRASLENGLRVVIVRNSLSPVVTTMVNYLVGSNEAPEGFPGMAHAQEHMMFRGSPGLSADQLVDIIATMGGIFDADTQQTVTQYFLVAPSEDLDLALHIEAIPKTSWRWPRAQVRIDHKEGGKSVGIDWATRAT